MHTHTHTHTSQDGQIDSDELQRCLTQSGISGNYQQFSKETCTIMINMLDRDYSGKMGFSEFKELWGVLSQWKVKWRGEREEAWNMDDAEYSIDIQIFKKNCGGGGGGNLDFGEGVISHDSPSLPSLCLKNW